MSSGSVNAFRALRKKLGRTERNAKKSQDKSTSSLVPAVGEPIKRKNNSLPNPPEISSPTHQLSARKISLNITDSPNHGRNPASPLIGNFRRDSSPSIVSGASITPVGGALLPTVNVMTYNEDLQALERQGIIDITVDVQNFLASIARLKQAMEDADNLVEYEDDQEPNEVVLKRLSELVQVVQTCLGRNSGMQSTEIKNAAMSLMQSYQDCPHVLAATCTSCNNAIEALIDAFTGSVQEFLTGETDQMPGPQQRRGLEKSGLSTAYLKGFSKSHDNLAGRYNSYLDLTQPINNDAVVDQIDQALSEIQGSVEVASKYLKTRLKYHREVINYLSKRAQIEARYHQQMAKLAKNTKGALDELSAQEPCLPLLDVFRTSVDQDSKFASNCNTTYNLQVGAKLIDPLEQKNGEYEKRRKEYTQTWSKEQKKLADARTAMKNAKARYIFLGQDLLRVKNLLAMDPYGKQADKRKKEVADYESKWQDAEMAYKNALAFCNDCQYQVHMAAKKSILCAYRRIMIDADTQIQSGLETYFALQHNFFQTLPDPMMQNLTSVKEYDVGSEFMRYISRHPRQAEELEDYLFEEFDPEAAELDPNGVLSDNRLPNSTSTDSAFLQGDSGAGFERPSSPRNTINPSDSTIVVHHSDGRSQSLSASPNARRARPKSVAYVNEQNADSRSMDPRRLSDLGGPKDMEATSPTFAGNDVPQLSKNAIAHNLKKLRGPARCRECDTYVYFHGFECEKCGLACHRKCLATLAIKCGTKRLARKMNTFGVDFQRHLKATKRYIPIIVTECIAEIDLRGLDTRGLYRVSSAKSKLEHLCQLFETAGDRVDLTDRPAHLIGSCLKLYFRQLPEPLLTFALYQDFVTFAREASYILPCKLDTLTGEKEESARELLERLKGLLQMLPYENYITLAKILYHLNRVSSPEHVKNNFMPPSNLGIVFAPNLLRQKEMVPSLTLLADMTAQAKVVEIMISHAHDIIHVSDSEIKDQELEDTEPPQEVLVDDPKKIPVLDVDDAMTAESRTPNTTPPERRRENVSELTDVLEALQLVGTRRSSHPSIKGHHPQLGEVRNSSSSISAPVFSNLPQQDTLAALSRMLRAPTHTPTMEKMLTPVQEKQIETDSDSSDDDIQRSDSQKIDGQPLSRSESGLSNPSISWTLFEADSEVSSLRDNLSILSEGEDGPLRSFRSAGINGSGRDRKSSKEEFLEQTHNNSHKGFSQGSDEYPSTFTENSNGVFNSPTSPQGSLDFFSSAEGTPTRVLVHSVGRPNLRKPTSDSTDTLRANTSAHSSTSHTTMSSQGSFSEDLESPDSTLKPANRTSVYEKYEKYRLANSDSDPTMEQSQESTQSTQDSAGTLTGSTPSEIDEIPPIEPQNQGRFYEKRDENISVDKSQRKEQWEVMRDMQKQLDSGIDERGSPDTRSEKSSSLKRSSLPEAVTLRNSRPFSEPVTFNSRESGLADSPDSESFLSELHPLNISGLHSLPDTHSLVTHVLRSPTEQQKTVQGFEVSAESSRSPRHLSRETRSRSNDSDMGCRKKSDVEIVISDEDRPQLISMDSLSSDKMRASLESVDDSDDDEYDTGFHQSETGPRSIESSTFSSIARIPVQRHSKTSESSYTDSIERRSRAASVDPPCRSPKPSLVGFSPKHEPHHKMLAGTQKKSVSSVASPTHSVLASSSASSESDLSFAGRDGLSKSLSALTSPQDSPKKKKKWGRRLQKTFKPALRVLRITPNSTPPPSDASKEDLVRDFHLSSHTPENSPSPSEPGAERVRMISPEIISTSSRESSLRNMKRSHSYDDVLDASEVDACVPVKVGSIEVVPEPKAKTKKGKLFSSFQGNRHKRRHKDSSSEELPVVLVGVKKKSVDSLPGDTVSKSPKARKKSRLPHFV